MINDPGWTSRPTTALFHRVVNWYNAQADMRNIPSAETLAHDLGVEPKDVGAVFDELALAGFANPSRGIGRGYTAHAVITVQGKSMLREYAERPKSRGNTIAACCDALLDWLAALDGESRPAVSDFPSTTRGHYFGIPFEPDVVREAVRMLLDHGLVEGFESEAGLQGAQITALGRDVMQDYDGSVGAWRRRMTAQSGAVTFNFGGDASGVAVAVNSPGATQYVTQTNDHRQQLIGLAEAFEQILPVLGLSEVDEAEARTIIGELRQIEPDPEPGKVKRLLQAAGNLAVAGAGNAAGTGIVALIQQIAQNWPF